MSVTGLGTVSTATQTSSSQGRNVLGKDDFLNLLVAQLKNQDPLKPIDSTEFTAQLAQFSSLESLSNINDTLNELKLYQTSTNNSMAVELLGRSVTASGNSVEIIKGVPENIVFQLAGNASAVSVNLFDAAGRLVKKIDAGALTAGEQTVRWDGTDNKGNALADGAYTFAVEAADPTGQSVNVVPYIRGNVTDIVYREGTAYLKVGSREVPLGKVILVSGNSTKAF